MAKHYHIERTGDGPDYYPLTTQEVIELLETAIALKDHAAFDAQESSVGIHSIAVRLRQGIPGKTYPYEPDTPVGQKADLIDEVYIKWITDPMTLFLKEQPLTENSEIVVTLINLMK